jgi:hypothetical protein
VTEARKLAICLADVLHAHFPHRSPQQIQRRLPQT